MQDKNTNIAQKVEKAAQMAVQSEVMNRILDMSSAQWVGILAELDEKEVDEFLYVMKLEAEGHKEIEQKRRRRHLVNDTRRLQRLERLKIRMEEINERIK